MLKKIKNLKGTIVNTVIIRKPDNLEDLEREIKRKIAQAPRGDMAYESVLIKTVWELKNADYQQLVSNFLKTNPVFEEHGGFSTENGIVMRNAIAIYCPYQPVLLIDPEGHEYARYVGILDFEQNN